MPLVIRDHSSGLWSDTAISRLDAQVAEQQDIRPLRVVLLNRASESAEGDVAIARLLSNSAMQVDLSVVRDHSDPDEEVSPHLLHLYRSAGEVIERGFDGLVVIGSPATSLGGRADQHAHDLLASRGQPHAGLHIGSAALDVLRRDHGVRGRLLPDRIPGVHLHQVIGGPTALLSGHDQQFAVPVVAGEGLEVSDLAGQGELLPLAGSHSAGLHIIRHDSSRQTYLLNDVSLDVEDLGRRWRSRPGAGSQRAGVPSSPSWLQRAGWRSHAQLLFANWLAYDVMAATGVRVPAQAAAD